MSVFIGYPSFMAYQMMKGKKDNNEGFPTIPGTIARYSALGLTNEQMAENPVWKDLTGNGHDLRMKNFIWGGMSGVGGYEMNFNLWKNNVPSIPDISMSTTTTSVSVSVGNSTYNNHLIYIHKNNWDVNKNHWLKVASTYEDGDLAFIFYNGKYTKKIELPANGYANIPAYPEFKGSYMYISTTFNKQGSFTIEQLPLYPGFILGDGVDDEAATIDNLDLEDTYTVYTPLILLKYGGVVSGKSSAKDFSLNTVVSSKSIGFDSANAWSGSIPVDLFEFALVVCKRDPKTMYVKDLITGKANQRNSKEFVPNPGKYFIWRNTGGSWCQVAIAGQIICNGHFSTDEDDEKVLDWYKKQYPWLFFDQAWTVTGKTNEDEDRSTIANITGNGNNLVLSNFGFAEGSGYGLYAQNYISYAITNRAVYTKTNSSIHITKSITAGVNFTESARNVTIPSYRIKVTGIQSGQEMIYRGSNNTFLTNIPSDGIYVLPAVENGSNLGFQFVSYTGDCDITIEQIPEYEGYLVTDGVDDKIISSVFKTGKDFTVVGEWVLLQNININTSSLRKDGSFVIRNHEEGLSMTINRTSPYIRVHDKSLKAFCSNGAIYKSDWTEQIDTTPQSSTGGSSQLMIAGYERNMEHDKIAFKNLAIYPTVLSKDDCIKAYNYLQTLKAK